MPHAERQLDLSSAWVLLPDFMRVERGLYYGVFLSLQRSISVFLRILSGQYYWGLVLVGVGIGLQVGCRVHVSGAFPVCFLWVCLHPKGIRFETHQLASWSYVLFRNPAKHP